MWAWDVNGPVVGGLNLLKIKILKSDFSEQMSTDYIFLMQNN